MPSGRADCVYSQLPFDMVLAQGFISDVLVVTNAKCPDGRVMEALPSDSSTQMVRRKCSFPVLANEYLHRVFIIRILSLSC